MYTTLIHGLESYWILSKEVMRPKKKLVGICFGHQVVAHALGGHASKSEKGWGLGLKEFSIIKKKSWMVPSLDTCKLYFTHQDQVISLPLGAELLRESLGPVDAFFFCFLGIGPGLR